jgi:hypothetical protein
MGKNAPQAPTPVDPTAVAGAQSAANKDTALFSSRLSNANQNTPYGSVTNTLDPTTNQWTQNTTLSPTQQALFNGSQQAEQTALGTVNNSLGQTVAPGQMQTSVQGGGQQAINDAVNANYAGQMRLLQPQMDQSREQHNAQLVAQGLNPNDAAWQNDMTLFNNSQDQQRGMAANSAVQAGQNEQNTLFGQGLQGANLANSAESALFGQQVQGQMLPIQEIAALAGGGQVQAPNGQFNPVQAAPTDVMGAYGLQAQQQQAQYQAQLQQSQGLMQGLMGLGQAGMMAFSDERLKEDIRPTGDTLGGFPLYRYRYVWDDPGMERVGVMAQEVQPTRPDVVGMHPSGFLMVDYGRLGR